MSAATQKPQILWLLTALFVLLLTPTVADAATLRLSPDTGVYTAGNTFMVRIMLNSAGQSINAAEGTLGFNPRELSVVSVSRSASIFNLWTEEPSFSNAAGTIRFGGGSPNGYLGSNGTVLSVTFRAQNAGSTKVNFQSGSVLAADGLGTNVLTGMNGGTYTIGAQTELPPPEPVYLPPANTPAAPAVRSSTHPDPSSWYREKNAALSWSVPDGVIQLRTLLDESAGTIPTKVYETPVSEITIDDLPEGVSYFHIQFRNQNGWGRAAHYRLGVDTQKPSSFDIHFPEDRDPTSPEQELIFDVNDVPSGISHFIVRIDGGDPIQYESKNASSTYTLPSLPPGHHSVIAEAFDYAGNSLVSTFSFDIASFDKPIFTEYPSELNEEVIPVIYGLTRPNSRVVVTMGRIGSDAREYEIQSDKEGVFTFIPDSTLSRGIYELSAVAFDEHGAQSDPSDTIRIAVQQPGYITIGSFVVSMLSVIVPLIALVVLLIIGTWYFWYRFGLMRRKVRKEALEAEKSLAREFDIIIASLKKHVEALKKSRHGKLTIAELELVEDINADLDAGEMRVKKEIGDIEDIVK